MKLRSVNAKALLFLTCAFVPIITSAQSWIYQSYPDGEDLRSLDKPQSPGYITLDESGANPMFQMFAGRVTKCFAVPLEAKVTKTRETTTMVVRRDLKGCGSARFVIQNDGSGGRREILRDGKWVWDGLERGLTPKN